VIEAGGGGVQMLRAAKSLGSRVIAVERAAHTSRKLQALSEVDAFAYLTASLGRGGTFAESGAGNSGKSISSMEILVNEKRTAGVRNATTVEIARALVLSAKARCRPTSGHRSCTNNSKRSSTPSTRAKFLPTSFLSRTNIHEMIKINPTGGEPK